VSATTIHSEAIAESSPETRIRLLAENQTAAEITDGERKTVTALFADIKGSMELIQDLDPEEARAIIDPALALMIEAVQHYGGYVVQSTGDGIFALFGAPVAHEDHPQRALYAAVRMQDDLRRYGTKLQQEGRAPIEIRVGVNSGEVVVRSIRTGKAQREYTPIGHTTNLAARLQAIARTGSIVVSENTRKLTEGYFQLRALGGTRVKGIIEPVNVYEVTGLGALRTRLQRAVGRGLTRFVGRVKELDALRAALELAKAGRGQIVATVGEPGVGKSRLYYEFKATSQSICMVLEAFSVSFGEASTYLPVIDLLRNYFDISAGDDERKRREKVTGRVVALDRSLEDTLPYLLSLLGIVEGDDPTAQMDGQIKKKRTHEAIKRILLRESLNQPLMLIFEDLHWIDGESEALLNLLADSIGTAKILLLVNYRPEYSHGWGSKTYYTQLRLDPLGRENAEEMLTSLLGDSDGLYPLRRLIIEKTEGTPFFMEETVQMLLDEGSLGGNGPMRLARPLAELKIPATVQAILASRIDRLPPTEKELLQTLAVMGREFPLSLVREVTRQSDDELNLMLNHLQLGEFIYEQPAAGDVEYVFKHALTQEVAYGSMLIERRKALHERAARVIETLYADNLDEYLDALAHHYSHSANIDKAVEYLLVAARQCEIRSAWDQALTHLDRGLELFQSLPESPERARQELAYQIARASSLFITQGQAAPETGRAYGRAQELCVRYGDRTQLLSILHGLRLFHQFSLELQTTRQLAEQLVLIAEELNEPFRLILAQAALGSSLLWMGEPVAARQYLEKARDPSGPFRTGVLPESKDYVQLAAGLTLLGYDLAILGFPDQAARAIEDALAWARGLSRPDAYVVAASQAAWAFDLLGSVQAAEGLSASVLAIAAEYGIPRFVSLATVIHGWARSWRGEAENGILEMRRSIAQYEAVGARAQTFWLVPLAETYLRIGQVEEASSLLTSILQTVRETGQRLQEPELYRLKGELLLKTSCDAPKAEACFRQAIEIARRQQAKWWELRATISLARLLASQSRRDEARVMLAAIYNWFTEGFDTADLKDAKALLNELAT
jgi:class 3 adenylate cyclase/tetratricopeptide (TPR) repeat protein